MTTHEVKHWVERRGLNQNNQEVGRLKTECGFWKKERWSICGKRITRKGWAPIRGSKKSTGSGLQAMPPSDASIASQALHEETSYRFPSFSASDAVTLGLSLRKRFRATSRHSKGKGLVISIQTIAGHTLFACTVGDLGHLSGIGDVSMDSWTVLDSLVAVVKRTGHSSYYVEKGMSAMGKNPKQLGLPGQEGARVQGGAFPIWLENAPCCPIAVVACYSGSSQDDHNLVSTTVRDYLYKLKRNSVGGETAGPSVSMPIPSVPPRTESEWMPEPSEFTSRATQPETTYDRHGHIEEETEFSH